MKKLTLPTEDFFKLSPGTERLFKEYSIKCVAEMYGDDEHLNRSVAKSLNITPESFNKKLKQYRSNPKLKHKFWAKYNENLSTELTNPKDNPWK